jgi:DNA-3-methyladenine glycosylase II
MWKEAEKFLLKDKFIGPLIKKYGHCSIRKESKSKYFETLVESIVSQQVSGKAAEAIYNRLKEALGEITPEKLAKTTTAKLRKAGLSRQKTVYLKDLAKNIENSKLRIENLDKLSDDEVTKELVRVKGIGVWTAKMFLMFSLARPDVFPIEDLGIRNSFKKMFKKNCSVRKIAQVASNWKPYRTVASWYLWRFLENR